MSSSSSRIPCFDTLGDSLGISVDVDPGGMQMEFSSLVWHLCPHRSLRGSICNYIYDCIKTYHFLCPPKHADVQMIPLSGQSSLLDLANHLPLYQREKYIGCDLVYCELHSSNLLVKRICSNY